MVWGIKEINQGNKLLQLAVSGGYSVELRKRCSAIASLLVKSLGTGILDTTSNIVR
jgi:hypothetical protein